MSGYEAEESSEPGTGNYDYSINHDDSADEGWRRETPPAGEDGSIPSRSATVTDIQSGPPHPVNEL